MIICFTLDDVIRAKTKQIGKIYQKYINPDIDLEAIDFSNGNFQEAFGFKDKKKWLDFIYTDYPYEIFGEAETTEKMVDKKLNLWTLEVENNEDIDEEVSFAISNPREFNLSIGSTCFFLAKIATRIREFFFPADSLELWDRYDVLVTADKFLLENKPENKIAIKIETDYNKDCPADFTYEKLSEMFEDKNIINEIIKKL